MARFVLLILLFLLSFPILADNNTNCEIAETTPPTIFYDAEANIDIPLEDAFKPQILAYLNSGASIEELAPAIESSAEYPEIFAQTVEADFTADNQTDVLVAFSISWGAGFEANLNLYTCSEASYQNLGNVSFDGWDAGEPMQILYALDINNNQLRDIILKYTTVEGMKLNDTIAVFEWDGNSLAETFSLGPSYGAYSLQLLSNAEQPAVPIISVGYFYAYEEETASAYIEYSFIRPINIIYQWDDSEYSYVCSYFSDTPSLYPTTLHSAEAYRACGDYETAKQYYEQLLGWWDAVPSSDSEINRWYAMPMIIYPDGMTDVEERASYAHELEQAYYHSFAAYRLLQIAIDDGGTTDDPQALIDGLHQSYQVGDHGYVYAAMAYALWDDYQVSGDLSHACEAAALAFDDAYATGADPSIQYQDDTMGGEIYHYGFYFANMRAYAADPNNLFAVPDSIDGMVSTPICL